MTRPERYLLTLEAPPGDVPAAVRLRRFLKSALRAHGLRCVSARPDAEDLGPAALARALRAARADIDTALLALPHVGPVRTRRALELLLALRGLERALSALAEDFDPAPAGQPIATSPQMEGERRR
jgi:hypothetical protein